MRHFPKQIPTEVLPPNPAICKTVFSRRSPAGGSQARDGERGAGRLKAIIWTLVFAAFIYVTVKVLPTLIDNYQFQDGIQSIARYGSATRQTPEQILTAILKEAQTDGVVIDAKAIKLEAISGNVRIHVDYSVTIDLTVYQWTLNFHPAASNDSLT